MPRTPRQTRGTLSAGGDTNIIQATRPASLLFSAGHYFAAGNVLVPVARWALLA